MDFEIFIRDTLIQHTPPSSESVTLPVIGIDECANHPDIRTVAARALHDHRANRVVQLWSQLGQRSNGSFVMITGGQILGALPPGEEYGLPVKGYSYPDEHVAMLLVAQLIASDRVIFLSENTRSDIRGIRWLLENQIRPSLESHHRGRFGILAFMKKGKSSWSSYAEKLLIRLQSSDVREGFEYAEV